MLCLDILKIFACFAVILQHNADLSITEPNVWGVHFLFYYIGRFAVPIFVMASGVLLLDEHKSITIRSIFIKYIPRIIFPLITIVYVMEMTDMFLTKQYTWKILYRPIIHVGTNSVSIPYWYIYMLIGLYMILPFVRKIVHQSSKKELEYFLLLFFSVRAVVPFLDIVTRSTVWSKVVNSFMLNIFSGYMALLVLGYYLNRYAKQYKTILLLIIDFAVVFLPLLYVFAFAEDKYNTGLFFADIFSANMLIHSILLFLIVKNICNGLNEMCKEKIVWISGMTFGIYILHVYIMQMFNLIGIKEYNWGWFQIPACALLNFIVCMGIISIGRVLRISREKELWKKIK